MSEPHSISFVSVLLGLWNPTAVAWFVVAITVVPLNGVPLGWHRPHINKEVFKVVPPIADGDSASAVMLIDSTLGVKAALAHALPGAMLQRARLIVRRVARAAAKFHAPAASGIARLKVATRNNRLFSAVAFANPKMATFARKKSILGIPENQQAAKSLSYKI